MSYCVAQDVKDASGTTLDDTTIARFITKAERKVKVVLIREGLSTTFGTVPDEIIEATAEYAAALCLVRHMTDGKLPRTQSMSGASATVDVQDAINYHNGQGDKFLNEYVNKNTTVDSPVRVVGRSGERTGEYEIMTEAEQEEV